MGYIKNKPIPIALINKAIKSICKIRTEHGNGYEFGTGFFLRIFSQKYLITIGFITNYEKQKENTEIEVEIYNKEVIKLRFKDRFIRYFPKPLDILAIEIKDSDFKTKDIEFLEYDPHNLNEGYSTYKDIDVFSLCYNNIYGTDFEAACSSGRIENVDKYEFEHSISTERGSSGSPIILFSHGNILNVIGIHISYSQFKRLNIGVFIGEIIKELPKNMNLDKQFSNKNKIYEKNNINNKKIFNNIDNNRDINKSIHDITNLSINNNINLNSYNYNKPINLNINMAKNENKDIINFSIKSTDQLFNSNIICRSKDRFNAIMNIIIEKEPSLAEKIGYFMCNGAKVNEYKSIKDNEIKNNNVVLMYIPD